MEIKLSDPEKSQGGFLVKVSQKTPFVTQWEEGKWVNQENLTKTLKELQSLVLQLLYEKRSSWFSSPPTKTVLTKLMNGWDLNGLSKPPDAKKDVTGSQSLSAVLISAQGIHPRFVASVWNEAPKISMPWTVSDEDELEEEEMVLEEPSDEDDELENNIEGLADDAKEMTLEDMHRF